MLLVETSWGTALGVAGLLVFVGTGFVALAGAAADEDDPLSTQALLHRGPSGW